MENEELEPEWQKVLEEAFYRQTSGMGRYARTIRRIVCPGCGRVFYTNSTAGSIARAKPVQGCTVENSGSKHGQILFAPAAEKYFMPTERMQSIAATPAGKRLTAKAGPRIKVPI